MTGSIQVTIRVARSDETHVLQECARQAYAQYVPLIGREPAPMQANFADHISRGEAFVADTAGITAAGYVVCFARPPALQVDNIAVFPEAAGRGIGTALLGFCETYAKERDLSAITLYTNMRMTRNLSLYPRLGFAETGRRCEDGFDRVYFRKSLD